jgi:hypothetical protein
MAGAVSSQDTGVIPVFSARWNIRPHRCDADPRPALTRFTLPPLEAIHWRNSAKFPAARVGLPITTEGASLRRPSISKSSGTL